MTGSPAKALFAFLLALGLGAALPVLAQTEVGAPLQLPGVGEEDEEEAAPEAAGPQSVPMRPGAFDENIQVGVISSRAPTIGTLSGTDGLGSEIWAGTSATRAQILLNQIPVGAPSRAMGNLVRLLLLTASRPPEDARGGDPIFELRLSRTLDAGHIDAVPAMIGQATHLEGTPGIQILRAETILLQGGGAAACTNETAQRFESEEPFWMKLRAYCFAHEGLVPAARLTADLLYDADDEDQLFQDLLERLSGNDAVRVEGPFDEDLSTLHLAMMRDLNIVPSRRREGAKSLSLARVMALHSGWSGEEGHAFRLSSGEMAARAGVLGSGELLGIYEDVSPFEPELRTEQLSAAANAPSAASRAVFAEALSVDRIIGTRAETLSAALARAAETDMGASYAAALGRAARDMAPEETLAWASYNFAIAALADGNLTQAYSWFDIFNGGGAPPVRRVQALLAALIMVAPSERFAYWPDHALLWLGQADLGEMPHARLAAQLMWFDAMGYQIPTAVRERLALHENELTGTAPPPAVIGNLREAAQAGRMGETVAYALVAIGPGGPRAAHPAALAEAIRALRLVGVTADARALATEALLGVALDDVE